MGEDLARPDDFQREREEGRGGDQGGGHGGIAGVGKGTWGCTQSGDIAGTRGEAAGGDWGLWDDPLAHPPPDSWPRQALPVLPCNGERSQAGALQADGSWEGATVTTPVLQAAWVGSQSVPKGHSELGVRLHQAGTLGVPTHGSQGGKRLGDRDGRCAGRI